MDGMGHLGIGLIIAAGAWIFLCIVVVGLDRTNRVQHRKHKVLHEQRLAAAKDDFGREAELASWARWLAIRPEPAPDWASSDPKDQGAPPRH